MSDDDKTTITRRIEYAGHAPGKLRPRLLVLTGSSTAWSFHLIKLSTNIGRGAEADIRLDDDGVSRRHAKVMLLPRGEVVIQDLGSKNGTYVNSERIERWSLREGDRIRVGARTCLQFTLQDDIEANLWEHLYSAATRDGLTKVFNRRAFEEQLQRSASFAKRHRQPLSVLLFDIDHFKEINDRHGHLAGDEVLRQLASLIAGQVRAEDTLARLGGEEFGLIVDGNDLAKAVATGGRLRAAVAARPFPTTAGEITVTVSVGAAQYDPSLHRTPPRARCRGRCAALRGQTSGPQSGLSGALRVLRALGPPPNQNRTSQAWDA